MEIECVCVCVCVYIYAVDSVVYLKLLSNTIFLVLGSYSNNLSKIRVV